MYVQYELLIYTVIVIPSQLRAGYEGERECFKEMFTQQLDDLQGCLGTASIQYICQ